MKTLLEIRNNYAQEQGYEDWEDLRIEFYGDARPLRIEEFMDEICIRAQKAYGENLLESAGYNYWINPEEITNPENLIR